MHKAKTNKKERKYLNIYIYRPQEKSCINPIDVCEMFFKVLMLVTSELSFFLLIIAAQEAVQSTYQKVVVHKLFGTILWLSEVVNKPIPSKSPLFEVYALFSFYSTLRVSVCREQNVQLHIPYVVSIFFCENSFFLKNQILLGTCEAWGRSSSLKDYLCVSL